MIDICGAAKQEWLVFEYHRERGPFWSAFNWTLAMRRSADRVQGSALYEALLKTRLDGVEQT